MSTHPCRPLLDSIQPHGHVLIVRCTNRDQELRT